MAYFYGEYASNWEYGILAANEFLSVFLKSNLLNITVSNLLDT